MDSVRILKFLKDVAANNCKPWMDAHRDEYLACRSEFEKGIADAIAAIAQFDTSVAHLTPKDCIFRFNRDTRFSQDKAPYKRHFGAYISAHGRKGLHAGYYIHLQPDNCLLSGGAYWLPTPILTAMRNEIMGNIDEWRQVVENGKFVNYFGYVGEGEWSDDAPSARGFGIAHLKTAPKDFPRDYEFIDYLRMKDYCVWHRVPDDFFKSSQWLTAMADIFQTAKPMMDFTNNVIDDYE